MCYCLNIILILHVDDVISHSLREYVETEVEQKRKDKESKKLETDQKVVLSRVICQILKQAFRSVKRRNGSRTFLKHSPTALKAIQNG